MIEVEKKFLLDEAQKERLLEGAQVLKTKTFTDTYFDTKDHGLILKDFWLRRRDDVFELKIPRHKSKEHFVDQYEEIRDEKEIRQQLGLATARDLLSDLESAGYVPFCVCTSTRESYQKDTFVIDLDSVTYDNDDLIYELAEIELMVHDESKIEEATTQIIDFAKQSGLQSGSTTGKVIYYLKHRKPDIYRALCKAQGVEEL